MFEYYNILVADMRSFVIIKKMDFTSGGQKEMVEPLEMLLFQ
jgi:hypothetical protein